MEVIVTMNFSSELNRSCEEHRLFGKQELSDNADLGLRYFAIGYNIVLFPISLSLTGLIIFLIIKFKHLQQTTFFLALQVAIFDFLFVLIFSPAAVISTINGQWSIGVNICNVSGGVFSFIFQFRQWIMFVFVCDRFCTVYIPFRYKRHRRKVILILCLTVLAIAIIGSVVHTTLDCFSFNRVVWLCINPVDEECPNFEYCQLLLLITIALGQIMGTSIPIVMYIALFMKAKKIRNQIIPSGTQEDAEQRKRDQKANITFFTLFLSLIGVNIPSFISSFVIMFIFAPFEVQPPEALLLVLYVLQQVYILLPIMDSIVILRNPEMRKAIKTLKDKLKRGIANTN